MDDKRFRLPERIDSLQALRFIGAMCITVYHFTGLQGDFPFDFSNAVYLFYMISGFVVMLSTRNPEKKKLFLTRRLIRLLPLYWLLTVLTFVAGQFVPSLIGYKPTVDQLLKSMAFIPYARATAKAGTAIRPLVGLGHTLQMEMLFYLLFLLAMRISHRYRGLIAAGFAAVVPLIGVFFPTRFPPVHFYTANPYVWVSFIIGLASYGLFLIAEKKNVILKHRYIPLLVSLMAAAGLSVPVFVRETTAWYSVLLFTAVFLTGLVFSACGIGTPILLRKAGDISYSYYLIHYYTVTLAARYLGVSGFSLKNVLIAAAVCAATWGISYLSWYVIENRLTRFLTNKVSRISGIHH